jgi:predicted GIY-YIG superfamily endonuclease
MVVRLPKWVPRQMGDWNLVHWKDIPDVPAVYAVFVENSLLYIGKTTRGLRKRFALHQIAYGRVAYKNFTGRPETCMVAYKECSDKRLAAWIEAYLVYALQPSHNICLRNKDYSKAVNYAVV